MISNECKLDNNIYPMSIDEYRELLSSYLIHLHDIHKFDKISKTKIKTILFMRFASFTVFVSLLTKQQSCLLTNRRSSSSKTER